MAEKRIEYPVGIQTFGRIIEDGYLYVDKTALIYDLVKRSKYVFLSRPRRFGKSLLMSTLEAYFKGRKELFRNLAMERLEKDWTEYPVFRFDLSGENFNNPQRLIDHIASYLDDIQELYGLTSEGSIGNRFRTLLRQAYVKYGQRVAILIDEYDKPLLDCLHDDNLHQTIKDELRAFYSVMKLSDEYIRFAMLTGVTKFGKVSIFSGLNNLKDISMWSEYNTLCGISESEFHRYFPESMQNFATKHGATEEDTWNLFKTLYDGYRFSDEGENIYNPFSVLSAFDRNRAGYYWYASGSPSYLIRLSERHRYLLANIEGERRSEEELSDISDPGSDFVPLLYQSGYLTIKDTARRGRSGLFVDYIMGFPNEEVYESFWSSLSSHFFKGFGGTNTFHLQKFLDDLHHGHTDEFMLRLRSLLADTNSEQEPDKEIHFQNMMAIACKMMGLEARTEIHAHRGRCDMTIETAGHVYVFEFKVNGSAEGALRQIRERDYAERNAADRRIITLIGANFSTETRTLTDWKSDTFKG